MAAVRIEDEAFSDERYDDLAYVAGLADGDHARIKMARLWRQCTIENRYVLPRETVLRVLGPKGVEAIVSARLGEVVEHGIRIRGTQGRIEWLEKLRSNGRFGARGGRPKANPHGLSAQQSTKPTRVRKTAQKITPLATALAPVPALAPAVAPAPAPASKLSGAVSRARRLEPLWVPTRGAANERAEREAKERGVDLRTELAKLRDWATGSGQRRADWDAVWRNWTRNARAAPGARQAPSVLQTLLADIDVMQRDEDRKKTEEEEP